MPDSLRFAGLARNAPCPCKSGKKFKHCHGAITSQKRTESSIERAAEIRATEAEQMLRARHQGYGRPLISFVLDGSRFVVVGRRLIGSRQWRFFNDFLLHFLKETLGREWGVTAQKTMPDLPLFRWLSRLSAALREGPRNSVPNLGYAVAISRLAYALYLIEHNDKPQKTLIARLKHPNTFDAAAYEALVASAFALAGSSIDCVEDGRGNAPTPEFFATFSSGSRFAVEAKRKQGWTAPFDLESEEFLTELKRWIRGKLHAASRKDLDNPVYWLELAIGAPLDEGSAKRLCGFIAEAVENAEDLTVKGQPAKPAYVIVTNNSNFANDDSPGGATIALLQGFRMEDFREGMVELEEAMRRHDTHRDIRQVVERMQEVQQVPTNFDGVPDELLDDEGVPFETLKIGEQLGYQRQDGSEGAGRVVEITAVGDEAYTAVQDGETAQTVILKVPLSEREARAAAKLGDAIFGKPQGPRETIHDPMRLYDWMLQTHANYARPYLLRQLEKDPHFEEYRELSDNELRVRVARELTKRVISKTDRPQVSVMRR